MTHEAFCHALRGAGGGAVLRRKDGSPVPIRSERAADRKRAFFDRSPEQTWGK